MNDTQIREGEQAQVAAREVTIPVQYGPEVSLGERLRRVHEEMARD